MKATLKDVQQFAASVGGSWIYSKHRAFQTVAKILHISRHFSKLAVGH